MNLSSLYKLKFIALDIVSSMLLNTTKCYENRGLQMAIEISPKQINACRLLATGKSITDTAKELNISRMTISRWLKSDNDFAAYLNTLKTEQLEAARTQIQHIASLAVETLANVMTKSKNDTARIAAAKEVLSMSGLTKETCTMYAWGVGAKTPEKVAAEKSSALETEKLLSALSGF